MPQYISGTVSHEIAKYFIDEVNQKYISLSFGSYEEDSEKPSETIRYEFEHGILLVRGFREEKTQRPAIAVQVETKHPRVLFIMQKILLRIHGMYESYAAYLNKQGQAALLLPDDDVTYVIQLWFDYDAQGSLPSYFTEEELQALKTVIEFDSRYGPLGYRYEDFLPSS